MEKVSPTVHLVIRSCIFCTTLTAFLTLLGAIHHKISFRGRLFQTLALLFKLVLDLVPVILTALNSSKGNSLDDGTVRLVDSILLCCSYTCITSLEHLFLWIVTSDTDLGWVIHRPGIAVTIIINLSLFVPSIKWRNESLHFWTISGASCLHFSLFCFANIWLIKHVQHPQKWSRLATSYLACLNVALLSLTSLFVGWKVLRARDLLPEILLLCTSAQLWIRICIIVATQARKKHRRIYDGARIGRYTGQNGRPPTSTSTEPLITVPPIPKESSSPIDPQPFQTAKQTVGNEGNIEALRDFQAASDLQLPRRKALIIINVQNDSFFVKEDLYITKNNDFVPRLKELIPYFRNDTDIFWVCTHMDQEATFYQEGTRGAEIYRDILDMVDETNDLIVIKHHHHSAFDQTSLLMALRKMLIFDVYLCGFLTNVGIYSTAADAVQHGLCVTLIEDCLGYRSEEKHEQAIGQMVEIMGVDKIDSEGIMIEYGGLPVPNMEPFDIPLSGLGLDTDDTTAGDGIMVATTKVGSATS